MDFNNNLYYLHTFSCGIPQDSILGSLLFIMYTTLPLSVLWSLPFPFFQFTAKTLAGKNVFEMTCFVSGGM